MSDLSGLTAVDPAPGPRRQGAAPDPELEALLTEYATTRHEPAAAAVPAPAPAAAGDVVQAPPVTASNAAHLAEIPTGFTMPAVEHTVPGPAPVTFDALVSAEDTFAVPDLPEGFVVPDLASTNAQQELWQPEAEATSWPEPLSFDETHAEAPILDDEAVPATPETPAAFEDMFEVPAPTFEAPVPTFTPPAPVVDAAPFEMPEWAGAPETAAPGEAVFTMPEDATPWQAYEAVEQHSQLPTPAMPPVAIPTVPVAAEYAPFEVTSTPAPAPVAQLDAAPAEIWTPAPQESAAPSVAPTELTAMLAAAPQFDVPQALPRFEVPAPVAPPATPAPAAQFEVPAAVQQPVQQFQAPVAPAPQSQAPAAVPQPVPQYAAPTQMPQFQVPPAVAQSAPVPAPTPQFEAPLAAPQFQAPPAAPAVQLPPPVAQPQPQAESALPSGFFDDDFDAPAPAPVVIPSAPAPAPTVQQPAPQMQPVQQQVPVQQPTPVPAAAPAPVEDDPANRLVAEVARVEARIPLSAVGANLTVNEDWLNQVLRQLVALEISDVHLHMSGARGELLIEGRRDGFLEKIRLLSGREATMVLNLVKSGSRISTGSNRVPGDGRYQLEIDNYPYQLRAVVTPLFDGGEKVVLRLPQTGQLRPLESLGFTARNLEAVSNLLSIPGGMTVIAGPMGEGKTTTAHAALMRIGGAGKAVMSLEDPVERALFDVAQVEVNEDIGSGFAANMKYLVRSDFDTLFLGEIRDEATAAAAVRIAQAGRRVITTIHATNNVTALRKLIQMSDGSALSTLDAVRGVVSQRLVRRLGDGPDGYLGRHPVHEVLTVDSALSEAIVRDESIEAIERSAADTSTTFAENARTLIAEGITDEREVRRVLGNVL